MLDQVMAWVTSSGLAVLGAILILIAGRIVAGILRGFVKKLMTKRDQDIGLTNFVGNMTYAVVMVFAIVAAMAKFGVQTASFVAVLGAAGFAVGFALQGSLANFASGVMLLLFRPFKVGDYVEAAGVSGSVQDIQLFSTILFTPDNVCIIVPNGKLFGDIIKNYSTNDIRRVDMVLGIGYGSSIERAIEITMGLIKADQRVLKEPEPTIAVSELADSSVNLVVRPWVKKEDYWDVKFELTRQIKEACDKNDIEIPFPQRVVHHVGAQSQN